MDRTGTAGVHRLLQSQAGRHPDRDAFVVVAGDGTSRSVSCAQFLARVERCAVALRNAGVDPADAVVLHLGTSLEFLTIWFALFRLGAVVVPTNLASPAPEIAHAMITSGATHVVTEPRFDAVIDAAVAEGSVRPATRLTTRRAGAPLADGARDLDGLVANVPEGSEVDRPPPAGLDPAEILFTSGTTSRPKGVVLTHSNLLRAGQRVSLHYGLTEQDRPLAVMPLFHTGGQCMGVLASLTVGATCVLTEAYSATRFWEQVREHRATFVMVVTTHVRTLLAQEPRGDDRDHTLRAMGFGLKITDDERDRFEERFGVRLTYCYGQTEACLLIAIAPMWDERRWPALGLPAFDRDVRIADEQDRDVPLGEVGQILVRAEPGRNVLLRYANDPEATSATLRGGWLHTGDNGHFDEAGYLHFVDRQKDMIKRAGENISALEVETVLTAHPAIEDAAVIGVPDPIRDEAVKAFVMLAEGAKLDVEAVQEHCRAHLAAFKVPTQVEFREDLPRTSIGKVSKRDLRAP